jgi:SAM-dependent methyltransferase
LRHAQVRQGDIYDLPLGDQAADAAVMHQVLHFLSDPQRAVREAARVLAPGGRLLIVDFAPHELEFLRDEFAHERLGFAGPLVEQWLTDSGLAVMGRRDLAPTDDRLAAALPRGHVLLVLLGRQHLIKQGFILVRRHKALVVANFAKGIPPNLVPTIPLNELPKRGHYELLSVVIPLGNIDAKATDRERYELIDPKLQRSGDQRSAAAGQLVADSPHDRHRRRSGQRRGQAQRDLAGAQHTRVGPLDQVPEGRRILGSRLILQLTREEDLRRHKDGAHLVRGKGDIHSWGTEIVRDVKEGVLVVSIKAGVDRYRNRPGGI